MIQLRPHQERIVTSMGDNPKGQVIVPTGGGKTLCMIVWVGSVPLARALHTKHKNAIDNTYNVWAVGKLASWWRGNNL